MSLQKKYPKIEDKINEVLSGENQKNALDFVAFLRMNNVLDEGDGTGYGWSIKNNGFMKISESEKELWIWIGDCIFDTAKSEDNELNNTVWENVVTCPQVTCPSKRQCGCEQDVHGTIFGKEYESLCYAPLGFFNPDGKTLENVKKLVLILNQKSIDTQRIK